MKRTIQAKRVCGRLARLAEGKTVVGTVHSVFDHAVNIAPDGRSGLIGLIGNDRPLTPFAASVPADVSLGQCGIRAGMAAALANESIEIPEAGVIADCSGAERLDLSVEALAIIRRSVNSRLPVLRDALKGADVEFGVSALATGAGGNVYSEFLKPRFSELAAAVSDGDEARALTAAERMAGCGVGLTPSSDDLLTGYFTMLRVLRRAQDRQGYDAILTRMAGRAAAKTNRISASFLLQSGEGLANEAVHSLIGAVFSNADDETVRRAAARVMSIGSTSGGDMLTGLILAIAHHDGGK